MATDQNYIYQLSTGSYGNEEEPYLVSTAMGTGMVITRSIDYVDDECDEGTPTKCEVMVISSFQFLFILFNTCKNHNSLKLVELC